MNFIVIALTSGIKEQMAILTSSFGKLDCPVLQIGNVVIGEEIDKNSRVRDAIITGIKDGLINKDTIVIVTHDDVSFTDDLFVEKLTAVFENPRVGVMGVAGTARLTRDRNTFTCGHYLMGDGESFDISTDHVVFDATVGYFENAVLVPDFFYVFRGSLLQGVADLVNLPGDVHLNTSLCAALCVASIRSGHRVVVADVLVFHRALVTAAKKAKYFKRACDTFAMLGCEFPATCTSVDTPGTNHSVEVDL